MRIYTTLKFLLGILLILSLGCEKFADQEKFRRPDWLAGKLYSTVKAQENLNLFDECLRLTGKDTILNKSGSWSVFAPTDEAIKEYLLENHYDSVSDIPYIELENLTEFHIVQNPWTLEQLQTLSASGWRSEGEENWDSYAFKRQTIFKNPNERYWIQRNKKKEMIVMDSTISDGFKTVFVDSRKYIPIFYDEYINANGITSEDYSFYFDRPYEQGNVYYAGAKILQADIFSENGFLHIIDRVVNPMLNAQEMLEREMPGETYKFFMEMVNWYYPTFEANLTATYNQPSVRLGGLIDTLWDLTYPDLAFDIHNERTGFEGSNSNETQVRHNGLFVPIDDAFRDFIDGILTFNSGFPHWSDYRDLPQDIIDIIFLPHFKSSSIYPSTSNYQNFFRRDRRFHQNEGDIIRREFGSNSTFIGLSTYIPDRLFTSVTGPVFLRPNFSTFRRALLYSRTYDVIANYDGELCFFPIPDFALKLDSSLILNWINQDQNRYNFSELNRSSDLIDNLGRTAISSRIMNHIGTALPNGSANKEFIPTMGGNFLILNNSENTVQGTRPSTLGFNGEIVKTASPASLDEPSDNGETYSVNFWFNFENFSLQTILWRYSKFFNLLDKAGLISSGSNNIKFVNKNENYTIFVPSNEALNNFQVDTLSNEELKKFLKYHFLKGKMIFTDNKQFSDVYNTESNVTLNIRTGPDIIEILDINGNPYLSLPEKEGSTNIMVTQGSKVTSVIHEIDKVLVY
jgi:uncharacterized surface protein with fasciclin (FAS1) repeats